MNVFELQNNYKVNISINAGNEHNMTEISSCQFKQYLTLVALSTITGGIWVYKQYIEPNKRTLRLTYHFAKSWLQIRLESMIKSLKKKIGWTSTTSPKTSIITIIPESKRKRKRIVDVDMET